MNKVIFKTVFFAVIGLSATSTHAAEAAILTALERARVLSCERTGMTAGQAFGNHIENCVSEKVQFPINVVVENVKVMAPLSETEKLQLQRAGLPANRDYPAFSFVEERVIKSATELAQLVETLRDSRDGTRFIIKERAYEVLMTLDFKIGKVIEKDSGDKKSA